MLYYVEIMLLLIYLILLIFFSILIWSGITILRRASSENRFQVLLPAGTILGIALYIFLINAVAHIIKGPFGFYLALGIQLVIAFFVKRVPAQAIDYPKNHHKLLFILSIFFFIPFLIVISAQGPANTADSFMHYSIASVFGRGDYPPHVPWQPDYISYYHLGVAQFLAALRTFTSASYELLFALFEMLTLACIALIVPWLYKTSKHNLLLFFSVSAFSIFSLGSFFLAWPTSFDLSPLSAGINWIKNLPTLADVPANGYGTQTNLLSFMLFAHRVLGIAIFIVILVLMLFPKAGKLYYFSLIILISSLALADESTFTVAIPAIFLVMLFTSSSSFLKTLLFIAVSTVIVVFQGGILSYVVFNPNRTPSDILIFPPDAKGPSALYENYRSSRFGSIGSTFAKRDTTPLVFFNVGIALRVGILLLISALLFFKSKTKDPLYKGLLVLSLASLFGLLEFIILIPKGYLHANGSRFVGLSYYFSGLVIIYLIYLFWEKGAFLNKRFLKIVKLSKILIIWTLALTIIPSIIILFPLQDYNWYTNSAETKNPFFAWIKQNIPQQDRILFLAANSPSANVSINLSIISQTGAFTPIWAPPIRSFYGADVSPTFFDIFYTLNPSLLRLLQVKYIIVGPQYLSLLPAQRQADINNNVFFKPVYLSDNKELAVLQIQDAYLNEAQEYEGTFTQLKEIAPLDSTYYIESPPAIEESMYRSTRLILSDRKMYYSKTVAFYNYQLDADLKYYGETADYYDYLILGKNTDPKTICSCDAELAWSYAGGNIKLWKTNSKP